MTDPSSQAAATAPSAPKPAAAKAAPKSGVKATARPTAGRANKPALKSQKPPQPPRVRNALMRPGLLPVTILVAVLVLGFKVGDIWLTISTGKGLSLIPSSVAQETPPQGLPEKKNAVVPAALQVAEAPPAQQHETKPAGDHEATQPGAGEHAAPAPAADPNSPAPSGAPGQNFTPTQVELLQRLQERREQLDARGRELDQREAILTAAETRFDQKIAELQTLKKEIQGLLTQANAEQQAQLDSLVKIYETMKPADAAKIFNNLDNNVLLNVISRMKEAKVAPVFAAMDEKRAQEVTILLAARKKLPTVPE